MASVSIVGQSIVALVQDVMSLRGIPGVALTGIALGSPIERLLLSRMEKARDVLIEELSLGRTTIDDAFEADESVAIIYRYGRAAQEGAARLNLRLMAKIMAGQKASRTLTAN